MLQFTVTMGDPNGGSCAAPTWGQASSPGHPRPQRPEHQSSHDKVGDALSGP